MHGITYREHFIDNAEALFTFLKSNVAWDERMAARKTDSFGVAYNYSQIAYPNLAMPSQLAHVCKKLEANFGFEPNNCLINYYQDGSSTMGFHSDQTDILEAGTGVAIVSLGEMRVLRFRKIADKAVTTDFELPAGSLMYMTQQVQDEWQHAIPKSERNQSRMSLTFRKMKA